ncbi:hypothetical protein [Paenibacillus sp. PL91]|uniref:hypothetical protein n=1 Tax=Paenibacillus sp. PL91 TaxID=2729538 RepID=UPI00145F33DC|nr:hypothetical protein [Paenibacillus sp. PL91]MBC9200888.1 hypothetical protein [Paenibacillus sp. PL91]
MHFRKKIVAAALTFTMSASIFSGLTFSGKTIMNDTLGFVHRASAAEAAPKANLQKLFSIHNALTKGDAVDVQAVKDLRVELAALDETADQSLIDPVWNKIKLKLPAYVDQVKLKTNLFRFVKAIRLYLLDPVESDLEQIRNDSEFRAALQTISAAAGLPSLTLEDFLILLLGDGGIRPGFEGTFRETLRNKSPYELAELINDMQKSKDFLSQEMTKVLGLADKYQVSRVLRNLGVKAQDVIDMQHNFETRLQKDDASFAAIAIAYMRSDTVIHWSTSHFPDDPPTYRYTLNIFGAYITHYDDLLPIEMSKISESPDLYVTSFKSTYIGLATLLNNARSATAVVQVKLLHPFGGPEKVILVKEIRHAHPISEFPKEPFFEKINRLHESLSTAAPADAQEVQAFYEELKALDVNADQTLIDPIWNKIERFLPASVDKQRNKLALFQMLKEAGQLSYYDDSIDLEAFFTNAEYDGALFNYLSTVQTNLYAEDLMIFLHGDGAARKGVQGTMTELLADQSPQELISLLFDQEKRDAQLYSALNTVLSQTDDRYYRFSPAFQKLGVTADDIMAVVNQFQSKLEHDQTAVSAMLLAYLRTHSVEQVSVSQDGRQHDYSLSTLGKEVPNSLLVWSKASGSDAVTVSPEGSVKLSKPKMEGSAVIQAKALNPIDGSEKIIFQKEVTLTAADTGSSIPQALLDRLQKLHEAIAAGDADEIEAIRNLQEEIAGLNDANDPKLIAPLWNKIKAKLPASSDEAKLKSSLFEMLKAYSSIRYDPQLSELEAIAANEEYRELLSTLAAAGEGSNVTTLDLLLFLFGDGGEVKGIEGTIKAILADKNPEDLSALLINHYAMNEVFNEALVEVLNQRETYALSAALANLGITPANVWSTVLNFQEKLKKDEPALYVLIAAYIRAEAVETVKITDNGRNHHYSLQAFGFDLPSMPFIIWKQISGSEQVIVNPNGTISIPIEEASGTAVIGAFLMNFFGKNDHMIFQKEVTLVNEKGSDPE